MVQSAPLAGRVLVKWGKQRSPGAGCPPPLNHRGIHCRRRREGSRWGGRKGVVTYRLLRGRKSSEPSRGHG